LFFEESILNQSDPTDNALAAIASILDRSAEKLLPNLEMEAGGKPAPEPVMATEVSEAQTDEGRLPAVEVEQPVPAEEIDIDHYEKMGPGPLDAIRFRWKARRDDLGNYYVDETIGPHSRPLSSGPMPKSKVVAFIDERLQEAEQRFHAFKAEMAVVTPRPDSAGDQGGES
jgi:hypothetical protein